MKMKYVITFLNRKGKIKSRVGCNTKDAVNFIITNWLSDEYKKPGIAIVLDTETGFEDLYER